MTELATRPIMESNQALQAALELSMLNLNNTTYSTASPDPPYGLFEDEATLGIRTKSQNITQCVRVPSSEHVAEIVGRQGCKIKALRAKTNTYIKTPVRGEEPIFIITGRPEDVTAAKREVVQAAEHFTQIRAARRSSAPNSPPRSPTSMIQDEKKITVMVRVPYRVVGLVVGPKGSTIKRIQQATSTYIVTPSREKEPCFEVKGTPENVERARKEIESYITLRTGGSFDNLESPSPDLDMLQLPSLNEPYFSTPTSSTMNYVQQSPQNTTSMRHFSESNNFTTTSSRSTANSSNYSFGSGMDAKDNFGWYDSPLSSAVFSASPPMSAPVFTSPSNKVFDFSMMNQMYKPQPPSPTGSCSSNSSDGNAVTSPRLFKRMPSSTSTMSGVTTGCCVCQERDVVAALVPCGHNLFCMQCAHGIASTRANCPVCNVQVYSTLRIQK